MSFLNHQNGESSHATDVVVSTTPSARSPYPLTQRQGREDLFLGPFWRQWMELVPSLLQVQLGSVREAVRVLDGPW